MQNPLSQDDIQELINAERYLNEAQQISRQCASCGIDVRAQDAYADLLRERIQRLKSQFAGRVKE